MDISTSIEWGKKRFTLDGVDRKWGRMLQPRFLFGVLIDRVRAWVAFVEKEVKMAQMQSKSLLQGLAIP